MRISKRAAFTLIELLVVIAIIAILIGLLIPAVQKVRETMQRTSCQNNLHNLGLALLNYENGAEYLPPGGVNTAGSAKSTLVFLLPYIEQGNVAALYNTSANWNDTANLSVISLSISTFQCPSVPIQRTVTVAGVNATTSDYNALNNVSVTQTYLDTPAPAIVYNASTQKGMLETNIPIRVNQVTDGMSTTFLFVEVAGRPAEYRVNRKLQSATANISGACWADFDGQFTLHGYSTDGATSGGPCPMNCTNNNELYSFHVGGVNVVFGDGSARFIRDNISIRTVAALVTRQGGEPAIAPD